VAETKKLPFNVSEFLSKMDGGRSLQTFRKDEKVFAQGDPADAVFYIQEGKVKVCVTSERGKEAVVALHGPADFFGEGCLTGQSFRLATVSAMTDCVIMRIGKADMVSTLRDEPELSEDSPKPPSPSNFKKWQDAPDHSLDLPLSVVTVADVTHPHQRRPCCKLAS
jgi:CRP/FNR family cyclic AMP-dependent transcriptional regulator